MERFGISVGSQLMEAVWFAGVGVLLGVWYDLFRLIRLLTNPTPRRVFVQDLLFFASAAAVTLLLALPISSGRVRVFHLLMLTLGFTVYYQTAGRLVYAAARLLVAGLTRLSQFSQRVLRTIGRPVRRLERHLTGRVRKAFVRRRNKRACSPKKKLRKIFFRNRLKLPPHL